MSQASSPSELLSAVDAVAVVSNLIPPAPVGALYLQNEEGTFSGKFFFKEGLIYAAKVERYEFPFAYRAAHSGMVDEDEQRSALASAGGDPSNPLLVSIYLQRHLLDKKTVESYLKENFLAVSGALLSMNPVRAEWRDNESTEDFAVRYIDVPMLVSLCQKRATTLGMAAERMGTTVEELFASPIRMLREVVDEDNLSVEAIWTLHKADGETSLDDAAAALGFTRLYMAKLVYRMWSAGIIEILASQTTENSTVETADNTSLEEVEQHSTEEDSNVVPLAAPEESNPPVEDIETPEYSFESVSPSADLQPIELSNDPSSGEEPTSEAEEPTPYAEEAIQLADPFQLQDDVSDDQTTLEAGDTEEVIPFGFHSDTPEEHSVNDQDDVSPETETYDTQDQPEEPQEESVSTLVEEVDSLPQEPSVSTSLSDDVDDDFALLAQAITNLTEKARLANVHVDTTARAVEDASAAVRESEEEVDAIAQVLKRLKEELDAQEQRLQVAEEKVSQLRRQEEEKGAEARQAQAQATLLTERLKKLRSSF